MQLRYTHSNKRRPRMHNAVVAGAGALPAAVPELGR
jgi:hypothetical protein